MTRITKKDLKRRKKGLAQTRKWIHGIEGVRQQQEALGIENTITGEENKYFPIVNEFESIEAYESYIEVITQSIKRELSNSMKGLAKLNIAFKFNSSDNLMEMNFVRFLFNLIMWRHWIVSNIPVTKEDIFNPSLFHNSKYRSHFDRFGDLYRDRFTMAEFSEICNEVNHTMHQTAVTIGPLFGNSISAYDMVQMAKRHKEIEDIINTELDPTAQVQHNEEFLRGQTERLFNLIIASDSKNNSLKPYMKAGVGVNKHQVMQMFVNLGYKPELDGTTIPVTTSSNLMTDGLSTPEAMFADSKGGLKAAVLQLGVSDSGYYG